MTFAGKIFTVLIFVFSLVLMGFAVSVYATHKNWYDEVHRQQALGDKPLGLLARLKNEQEDNERLRRENDRLSRQRNAEIAARRVAIARAETIIQQLRKANEAQKTELAQATEGLAKANAAMTATQMLAADLGKENDGLRTTIRDTHKEYLRTFNDAVALVDKNHRLQTALDQLNHRTMSLVEQLSRWKQIAAKFNLNEFMNVSNVAPRVEGVVTSVRRNGQTEFVSVSVGAHDKLQVDYQMDVYRGDSYVGRIRITNVKYDTSVGEVEPRMKRLPFQVGDKAYTVRPQLASDKQANAN
jgi:hypothetical protein